VREAVHEFAKNLATVCQFLSLPSPTLPGEYVKFVVVAQVAGGQLIR